MYHAAQSEMKTLKDEIRITSRGQLACGTVSQISFYRIKGPSRCIAAILTSFLASKIDHLHAMFDKRQCMFQGSNLLWAYQAFLLTGDLGVTPTALRETWAKGSAALARKI